MNAYRISPVKYPWPAFFYLAALALALGLQRLVPLDIPDAHTLVLKAMGIAVAFLGAYLVLWASAMLFRNRNRAATSNKAGRLVIAGPFRYSRNPIYLGYTLLTIGYGIHIDNGWIPLAAIAAAIGTHLHVIRKEEMHLLARFGYEFERYCRRTRAWI